MPANVPRLMCVLNSVSSVLLIGSHQNGIIGVRHGDRHHSPRLEHAVNLLQPGNIVVDVFEDFREDHRVEGVIGVRQRVDVAVVQRNIGQVADVALRLEDHVPVEFRADQMTFADVAEHIQVKAASARHIEDQLVVGRLDPLEDRLHALLERHVRFVARHVRDHLRIDGACFSGIAPVGRICEIALHNGLPSLEKKIPAR